MVKDVWTRYTNIAFVGSPSPDIAHFHLNIHTYITISWDLQIITDYIFVYLTKARIGQWRVIVGSLDYFVEV